MKKIKILICLIIFFGFSNISAYNTPIGYWGNTFTKNNKINNTNIIPIGYFGNNFNKEIVSSGVLNQTPIGFFADYNTGNIEALKIKEVIYNTGFIDKEKIIQDKINELEKRIALAKASGEIYTYRLREYIKNNDGTFTNINTLRPYSGNVDNLRLKVDTKNNINNLENTNIKSQNNINTVITTNEDIIKSNEKLVNKINEDIKKKQELQIKKDLEIRRKIQEKQDKINKLEKRIALAKVSGEIYTYRLREYIKNDDGTFTNIDTLRPYGGNVDNLEKKTDKIKRDLEKKNNKRKVYSNRKTIKTTKSSKSNRTTSEILKKKYKTITNKDISIKKEKHLLNNRQILEDILYIYYAKQQLSEIKKNDYEKYIILKSCLLDEGCSNLNYLNDINKNIYKFINLEYLAISLDIDIKNNKSIDYASMLKIIIKVFGKDKYSNLSLSKTEYFNKIDKILSNIFKKDKKMYNELELLSYKRIYFSLIESKTFGTKLHKLLFKQ